MRSHFYISDNNIWKAVLLKYTLKLYQNSVYAILRLYYVRYFIMVYNLLFEHFAVWIPRFKVFVSVDWMKDYYCTVSFQFYNL